MVTSGTAIVRAEASAASPAASSAWALKMAGLRLSAAANTASAGRLNGSVAGVGMSASAL
ncbi:hypothetical protein D3C86_2254580 [compost metagenome]